MCSAIHIVVLQVIAVIHSPVSVDSPAVVASEVVLVAVLEHVFVFELDIPLGVEPEVSPAVGKEFAPDFLAYLFLLLAF